MSNANTNMRYGLLFAALTFFSVLPVRAADNEWTLTFADGKTVETVQVGDPATIVCGQWKLNCYVNSRSAKRIIIGKPSETPQGAAYQNPEELSPGKLDLSIQVRESVSGEVWNIFSIRTSAFASSEDGRVGEYITELVLPTTLAEISNNAFRHYSSGECLLTNVVFCAENLVTIANYVFWGQKNIRKLDLKIPNAKSIGDCAFYNLGLEDTDATEWDLSSVTNLGNRALAKNSMKGSLSLPKCENMVFYAGSDKWYPKLTELEFGTDTDKAVSLPSNAFFNCYALAHVRVGTRSSSVKIGGDAFRNCTALKTVEIGSVADNVYLEGYAFRADNAISRMMIGGSERMAIESNALGFSNGTERVQIWYTGKPLEFVKVGNLGYVDNAAANVRPTELGVVYVVPDDAEWASFLSNMRTNGKLSDLTEDEVAAFRAESPTLATPFAVAEKGNGDGTMHVYGRQFVTTATRAERCSVRVSGCDSRYGESFAVTSVDGRYAADADGTFPRGATVDVSAEHAGAITSEFIKWTRADGSVTDENPLRIVFGDDGAAEVRLLATYRHEWRYDPSVRQITDGVWTFNTYADANGVGIGSGTNDGEGSAFVAGGGSGDLDLRGDVYEYAAGVRGAKTAIVATSHKAFAGEASPITSCIMPSTLQVIGQQLFHSAKALTNFTFVSKTYADVLPAYCFFDTSLRKLTLVLPHATAVERVFAYSSEPTFLCDTDASDWDLTGIRTVAQRSFARARMHGTLCLPNLTSIANQGDDARTVHNYGAFDSCVNLEGVVLGTNIVGALSIASNAFRRCTSLTKAVLGGKRVVTVGESAFQGANLADVTFHGRAPTRQSIDRVLETVTVPTDGSKNCILRGGLDAGFGTLAQPAVGGENPPAGAYGVYVTESGERKAWMTDYATPYPLLGLILMVK